MQCRWNARLTTSINRENPRRRRRQARRSSDLPRTEAGLHYACRCRLRWLSGSNGIPPDQRLSRGAVPDQRFTTAESWGHYNSATAGAHAIEVCEALGIEIHRGQQSRLEASDPWYASRP